MDTRKKSLILTQVVFRDSDQPHFLHYIAEFIDAARSQRHRRRQVSSPD